MTHHLYLSIIILYVFLHTYLDAFDNVSFKVFILFLSFFFRFITILYFLNDVEEGGQTAFLMADNTTVTPEVSN